MKRPEAIQLQTILNGAPIQGIKTAILKAKNLSSDNFLELHYLKLKLKKYISDMAEAEKAIFEAYDLVDGDKMPTRRENPTLWEKIDKIQSEEVELAKLNFIEKAEFDKFTEELDVDHKSFLKEYLEKP